MNTTKYAVVDIGASNTRIGWHFRSATDFKKFQFPTLKIYGNEIQAIVEFFRREKISHLIVGIASPFDVSSGKLLHPLNLKDYAKRDIVRDFRAHKIKASLFNDVELAALGEAVHGAGRGFTCVAMVSIATGAGGALIKNKEIIRGKFNFEPGHQILELTKSLFPGKAPGSFESFISGSAFKILTGREPETLSEDYFKRSVRRFAQALANVAVFWAPEIVVLVGPVAARFEKFLPALRRKLRTMVLVTPPPQLAMGKLGGDAALIGGFAWRAMQR
ncbi:MAG: ROK family protein [Candidatus Liptonbacteria bacterium]|nr:ROK family protein [Candidatus Liptonbacteria bacterium]